MTRADTFRQRAATYAEKALSAEPRYQAMYAELARAWRELADDQDGLSRPQARTSKAAP